MIMVPYSSSHHHHHHQSGKQDQNRSTNTNYSHNNYANVFHPSRSAMNQAVEVIEEGAYNYNNNNNRNSCFFIGSDNFVVRNHHMMAEVDDSRAITHITEPEPEPHEKESEEAGSTLKEEEDEEKREINNNNNNNSNNNWLQLSIGYGGDGHDSAAATSITTTKHDQEHHHHHLEGSSSSQQLVELELLPSSGRIMSSHHHLNYWGSSSSSSSSSSSFSRPSSSLLEPQLAMMFPSLSSTFIGSYSSSLIFEQTCSMSNNIANCGPISAKTSFVHNHHHNQEMGNWASSSSSSSFGLLPNSMPIMPSFISSSSSSSQQSCSSLRPLLGSYNFQTTPLDHHHHLIIPSSNNDNSGVAAGPSFHDLTSNVIRVVDPPRRPHSGIWFMLLASQNQAKEPFLPQITKSYLRIKDGRMTVRLLMKYLVSKLRLESESEVEIRCRGQQVLPLLTLQHVRDNIWTYKDSTNNTSMTLLSDNSLTSDHVMVLHYGRTNFIPNLKQPK